MMKSEQIEDLIDKFPNYIEIDDNIYFFTISKSGCVNRNVGYVTRNNKWLFDCRDECLVAALNKALIWLCENGYVDFKNG